MFSHTPQFLLFSILNFFSSHLYNFMLSSSLFFPLCASSTIRGKQVVWVGFKLRVKRVVGKKWVILNELKMGLGQSGCGLEQIGLGWPVFFTWIFYLFIIIIENNMYLPLRKSRNKLFNVKCNFEFTTHIKNELS